MTARMSALPLLQMCGGFGELSKKHGSGRAAALSRAFHAREAKAPEAAKLLSLLTDEERAEVESWKPMPSVTVGDNILSYELGNKELKVAIDRFGYACDYEAPEAMARGLIDVGWDCPDLAVVVDIKKSVYTTNEGPESLQLHGYGMALASLWDRPRYLTGLWCAQEGEWLWSKEVVEVDSARGQELFARIFHAATNDSKEYSTGPHCNNCFERLRCQEYALPAHTAETWLTPFTEADFFDKLDRLTPDERGALLVKLDAMLAVGEVAKKQLKTAVDRGLEVTLDGKRWGKGMRDGRESVSVADLRAALGDDANRYVKRGQPYPEYRWRKQ